MDVMAEIRNFEGCSTFCQELAYVSNSSNDGEKKQRETVKKKRFRWNTVAEKK